MPPAHHRCATRAPRRAVPSYVAERLESRLLLAIWYSNYGQSRSHLIYDVGPGDTHDFEVNGIAANTTTQWWVNGTYLGSAEDDLSGFLALDPQLRRTFNGPGSETRVEARVLENPVESHVWRVRVPDVAWDDTTVEAGHSVYARMLAGPPHDAQALVYESENDLSTDPIVARLTFAGTSAGTRIAEWIAVWKHGRDVFPHQSYYIYYPQTEISSPYLQVVDTTPPSPPALTSPADDEAVTTSNVTFLWAASADSPYGSGFKSYTLQVDDNPNFSSPLVNATNLPAPGRTASVPALDTYYWRVIAYDQENNSRISSTNAFRRMNAQVTELSWRGGGPTSGAGVISGIHLGHTAYVRVDAVGMNGQTRQVAIWAVDQTDPEAATTVATIDVTIGSNGVGFAPWVAALPAGASANYAFQLRVGSPTVRSDWLDVVDTPRVSQVYLHGSDWSPAFRDHLEQQALGSSAYGWPIGAGAAQLADAPWTGADRVSVRFTEDVVVGQGDLAVHSSQAGVDYGFVPGTFSYDPATFTATWVLEHAVGSNPLVRRGGDSVRLELSADPAVGVRAAIASGRPLDGEWADGAHAYPSGDGSPGGVFAFTINVLPGNADRQFGRVNAGDQGYIKARLNRSTTSPTSPSGGAPYTVFADVTADGRVNAADQGAVKARLNTALPAASPSFATASARLPTPFGDEGIASGDDLHALLA